MAGAQRELPTILASGLESASPSPSPRRSGLGSGPVHGLGAKRLGYPEVYAAIGLLSFLVARFVPVLRFHLPCPFLFVTGHPCATCGMTRAFVALAHGQVVQAFQWSPLGALLAVGAWTFAVADLVRAAAGWPLPRLSGTLAQRAVMVGVAALLLNWAYLLIHGLGP